MVKPTLCYCCVLGTKQALKGMERVQGVLFTILLGVHVHTMIVAWLAASHGSCRMPNTFNGVIHSRQIP